MKDAYYFSHDANARHDPRILLLRAQWGDSGYARYFMIIEMMREAHNYRLKWDDYLAASMGLDLGVSVDEMTSFINRCVDIGLFKLDTHLYSDSLLRRMEEKEKLSMKRSDAGSKGLANRWQTLSKPIAVKERKGKESKEQHTEYIEAFELFWSNYPRKVGKGKAMESWNKHAPPLSTCLDAIKWQKNSPQWAKDGGQYIPHPSTWLNQQRWLDVNPTPILVIHPSWLEAEKKEKAIQLENDKIDDTIKQAAIDKMDNFLAERGMK